MRIFVRIFLQKVRFGRRFDTKERVGFCGRLFRFYGGYIITVSSLPLRKECTISAFDSSMYQRVGYYTGKDQDENLGLYFFAKAWSLPGYETGQLSGEPSYIAHMGMRQFSSRFVVVKKQKTDIRFLCLMSAFCLVCFFSLAN